MKRELDKGVMFYPDIGLSKEQAEDLVNFLREEKKRKNKWLEELLKIHWGACEDCFIFETLLNDVSELIIKAEDRKEKEVLEKMKEVIKEAYPEHDPKNNHTCKTFYDECACNVAANCLNTVLKTINSRLAEIEERKDV